jgi:hypothetical protein
MKYYMLLLLPILALIAPSCNKKTNPEPEIKFVHTVFFWLNENTSTEERIAFESGLVKLGTTPSILKYYYGKPAGTSRDVIDSSYDYAWIVYFPDAASQDEYQNDPIHPDFIENHKHLWKTVKVYDTLLE